MHERLYSSLNLLLDTVEGSNLLLEFYTDFSKKLFFARDFKSILRIVYEELKKIYISQKIEIVLWHNNKNLVKFEYDEHSHQVAPIKFTEHNTLYNYVLEKHQSVLTNNYPSFCTNLGIDPTDIAAISWLGIPMTVRDKVLGSLVIWDDHKSHYLGLQDKQFLTTIADKISFVLENIYLYDYISDKKGSFKIFESFLPKGKTKNSVKAVLTQLLQSMLKQNDLVYTGLFLRSNFQNKWRLIEEAYDERIFSTIGLEVNNGLTKLTEEVFNSDQYYFWNKSNSTLPKYEIFAKIYKKFPVTTSVIFPFNLNQIYLGTWIICFSTTEEHRFQEEIQLYRFVFYIITQLLEKKALIEKKRKYESHMQHLERMKVMGELASGTAHHLNNIFSVILGKSQMLNKKLEKNPLKRDMELILQAAEDGANSIHKLQHTVSENHSHFELAPVDINEVIRQVVEIAKPRIEENAKANSVNYHIELTLGKRPKLVSGDAPSLREVLLNIINNAIDAMPSGGKLSILTSRKEKTILLFISDTGVGIPEKNTDKIFEPFFTTKGTKGNGLGLSIAANIIQKHNGKIFVDSILNKGSIFMLELPALDQVPEQQKNSTDLLQNISYKVLLVDDEGIVRETLAEMLEEKGCDVTTASNAEEAILNFKKFQCDLVFTDLSMPGVDGIGLAKKLKRINSEVPVLLITGWSKYDNQLIECNNQYIDGIIHKPFNMENVQREIAKVTFGNGSTK
jgi:signal transduction histidine kinase/ActR/RegA family two-component response regulator